MAGLEGKCREGNKEGRGGRGVSEDCWRRDLQIYEDGSGNNLCRVIQTRKGVSLLLPPLVIGRGRGLYTIPYAGVVRTYLLPLRSYALFMRYVGSLKHAFGEPIKKSSCNCSSFALDFLPFTRCPSF